MTGGGYSLRGGPSSISSGYSAGGDFELSTSTRSIAGPGNSAPFLNVGIVDDDGYNVQLPWVAFPTKPLTLESATVSSTLGTSSQKIRITNTSDSEVWSVSIAAENPSDLWVGENTGFNYDFNDPTAGAEDGADPDSFGGQLVVDPSSGIVSPQPGCSSTGVSLGTASAFEEGSVDSITLISSDVTADLNCYWDITGVSLDQIIPGEQAADNYSLDMVVSIVAS